MADPRDTIHGAIAITRQPETGSYEIVFTPDGQPAGSVVKIRDDDALLVFLFKVGVAAETRLKMVRELKKTPSAHQPAFATRQFLEASAGL